MLLVEINISNPEKQAKKWYHNLLVTHCFEWAKNQRAYIERVANLPPVANWLTGISPNIGLAELLK